MRQYFFLASGLFLVLMVIIGACKKPVQGCTDPTSDNYDPQATIDNGSCFYSGDSVAIYGCMNINSDNYNPNATVDDGSCYACGCMDSTADNYNALATVDTCGPACIDARLKFLGDFVVTHDCGFGLSLEPNPSIILDSMSLDTILIEPFMQLVGGTARGKVKLDSVIFPSQTIGITTFDGRGIINTSLDSITINFNYDAGFAGSGSCTSYYVKL